MPDLLYYLLILPGLIFGLLALFLNKSTSAKYQQQRNLHNLNGLDVAEKLGKSLAAYFKVELTDTEIDEAYHPKTNVLTVPRSVALNPTIYAMAFAAHQLGSIDQQHQHAYLFAFGNFLRNNLELTTSLGYFFVIAGLLIQYGVLSWIGIGFFILSTLMALLTLPISRFASKKGLAVLIKEDLLFKEETFAVEDMLGSLDLSAVAKLAGPFANFLKYS